MEGFAYFIDNFIPPETQFSATPTSVGRLHLLLRSSDAIVNEGLTPNETANRLAAVVILMQLYRCPWVSRFTPAQVHAFVSAWPWSTFGRFPIEVWRTELHSASTLALDLYAGAKVARDRWLCEMPFWTIHSPRLFRFHLLHILRS